MSTRGILWLVATPIGHLGDMTARAAEILKTCDWIAAEDTRRTGALLHALGIEKRMRSYFEGNERDAAARIVESCRRGETVAVVTSAGHPCVSDPGYRVVQAAHEAGIPVSVAPGACAAVSALAVSGLPSDRFTFHGFLPRSGKDREEALAAFEQGTTHVLYESPRRAVDTLRDLSDHLDDPPACVVRELTKLHEEILTGRCRELAEALAARDEVLGEITIVLHRPEQATRDIGDDQARRIVEMRSRLGMSDRDAALAASILLGVPKNAVYRLLTQESKTTAE